MPLDIQIQQQQPTCQAHQSIQSCLCGTANATTKQAQCQCTSSKTSFQYPNMAVNSSACFCLESKNAKSCNCCLSDADFQKVKPQCIPTKDATPCKCAQTASGYACNCTNKYFYNTVSANTPLQAAGCSCFGDGSDCQCCLDKKDLTPAPQCSAQQSQVSCSGCKYNATLGTVTCGCSGVSVFDGVTPVTSANQVFSAAACACTQDSANATTSSCTCCESKDVWQLATPVCSASQTSEKCKCMNAS